MSKSIVIVAAVALLLSACAGPMQMAKEGATQQDLKNDQYDCQRQYDQSAGAIAYKQDPLAHLNELGEARSLMQACLERKGWQRVQ